MDARINAYRRQLAKQLGSLDMRAIPGFGTDGAPLGLDLAATMVLPCLRSTHDGAEPQALGDVLAQQSHVVLQGEPGAGKTTLLSCLCLAYASDSSELLARIEAQRKTAAQSASPRHLVPVLLRLSSFAPKRGTAGEFAAFVREQLSVFPEPMIAAVMHALDEGRGLVCLDGLDEVSDDPTRRRVARSFEAWTRQYTNRCWVTTRKHGALTLADHFRPVEVIPFRWAEIREYLIRREGPSERDLPAAEARAEAWLRRLRERPQLLELVRRPLLLVLALAVEAADRRLPVERVHLQAALLVLLQQHLRSDDLSTVRSAVRILDYFFLSTADLSPARGRLLDADDLAARRAAIRRWLSIGCPPERREAFARKYFGRGIADLAAALRPCIADIEPLAAIEAGLLLRRLTGEVEPLRVTCQALLAAPAVESTQPVGELIEHDAQLGFFLDTERTRELHRAVGFARRGCPRTWAVLALDDLGAGDVPVAIRELFGEPDERGSLPGWADWILQHRPDWLAQLEPRIVGFVAHAEFPWIRELAQQLRERDALTPGIVAAFTGRWPEWLASEWSSDDSSFAEFIGASVIPDAAAQAVWGEQLRSSEPVLREQAALALGMSRAIDDKLADALIDIFFAWRPPAAQRAHACLRRPECAAVFGARRRARASRWQTPEDASEILMLWSSSEECVIDRDVTLPLLRAASGREDAWAAFCSAELLESIDGPAGLVAMTALAHRSTQAAAWLVERGQAHPAADARLWQVLEHPEGSSEWELAAAVLLPGARDDPRVPGLLAGVAARGDRRCAEKAIWLLADTSRERALVAILERLAHETEGHREADKWLMALSRGHRSGHPPRHHRRPQPEPEGADDVPTMDIFIRRPEEDLRYASTLDHLVEALIELEPQLKLDLPGATATLLAGDAARWSELWRRAKAGETRPEEIDELRSIIDLRLDDGPGQRLARLYWRLRLPESALLERDAPASSVAALARKGASAIELLVELLRHAFDDDAGLRRFMDAFGLRDALAGPTVSLKELRHCACDLLLQHKLTSEAVELMSRRGLLAPEELHVWNLAWAQR